MGYDKKNVFEYFGLPADRDEMVGAWESAKEQIILNTVQNIFQQQDRLEEQYGKFIASKLSNWLAEKIIEQCGNIDSIEDIKGRLT